MPRSPVHNVLFCQEILVEILAYLSPGWFFLTQLDPNAWSSEDREAYETRNAHQRTLASCTQACHAFSDLALAELWKVLDQGPDLLLRLLPWRKDDNGLFHDFRHPDSEIDGQAWSRFRRYARLVREMHVIQSVSLDIDAPEHINIHCNTWALLVSRLQGEPLLPSLRRLQMLVDLNDIMPSLFLLSPTVRPLTFEFGACWQYKRILGNGFNFLNDQALLDSFLHLISGRTA